MWHPIPKGFFSAAPRASRLTMTPHVVHALFHYKTHSPQDQTPTPALRARLFKHPLPCECFSHHSPSSVILGTGTSATGLCFQVLQLLTEPPFLSYCIEGPFCQDLQSIMKASHFLSKVHNALWREKSEGIYITVLNLTMGFHALW